MGQIKIADVSKLKDNNITFIQYSADWCGPCRTMLPVVNAVSREPSFANHCFYTCNITEHMDDAKARGISRVPAYELIKNGVSLGCTTGIMSCRALHDWVFRTIP